MQNQCKPMQPMQPMKPMKAMQKPMPGGRAEPMPGGGRNQCKQCRAGGTNAGRVGGTNATNASRPRPTPVRPRLQAWANRENVPPPRKKKEQILCFELSPPSKEPIRKILAKVQKT